MYNQSPVAFSWLQFQVRVSSNSVDCLFCFIALCWRFILFCQEVSWIHLYQSSLAACFTLRSFHQPIVLLILDLSLYLFSYPHLSSPVIPWGRTFLSWVCTVVCLALGCRMIAFSSLRTKFFERNMQCNSSIMAFHHWDDTVRAARWRGFKQVTLHFSSRCTVNLVSTLKEG